MSFHPVTLNRSILVKLGGLQPDDPPLAQASRLGSLDCIDDVLLPDSGAAILRILWRHLWRTQWAGAPHSPPDPLRVLDVPQLLGPNTDNGQWALRVDQGGWSGQFLIHLGFVPNCATDPCKVLVHFATAAARAVEGKDHTG